MNPHALLPWSKRYGWRCSCGHWSVFYPFEKNGNLRTDALAAHREHESREMESV